MKPLIQQLLLSTIILCLFSCKKDKSETKKSIIQLLPGNWKMTYSYRDGDSLGNENLVEYFKECEKDDYLSIFEDGIFVHNRGVMPCISPKNDSMTWKLVDSNMLTLYKSGMYIMDYDIKQVTESTLELVEYLEVSGEHWTAYMTFTKM